MSNSVVIIGSNSFSGSHFVDHLLSKGINCIGISRSPEPNDIFLPYKNRNNQLDYYQLDLNRDLNEIVDVIRDSKSPYVVNYAAQGMVAESWERPEDWYLTNVIAQVKLHDQLRRFDFLEKYIHVTTPEVYGSMNNWASESFNFNPSTPYAISRAACDYHLKSVFEAYKFPVVFTRSANVYGEGQQLYRIVPRAILYGRLGKKLFLHGQGMSERSFIHINDVNDATYRILLDGKQGNAYHISTTKVTSIRNLVKMVCGIIKVDFRDLVEDSKETLGKDHSYLLNTDKIRGELGWQDTIALDEGIRLTVEWIDHNLVTLENLSHKYTHRQ